MRGARSEYLRRDRGSFALGMHAGAMVGFGAWWAVVSNPICGGVLVAVGAAMAIFVYWGTAE